MKDNKSQLRIQVEIYNLWLFIQIWQRFFSFHRNLLILAKFINRYIGLYKALVRPKILNSCEQNYPNGNCWEMTLHILKQSKKQQLIWWLRVSKMSPIFLKKKENSNHIGHEEPRLPWTCRMERGTNSIKIVNLCISQPQFINNN